MMERLFLARHGETLWNRADRLQGQTDVELNDAGRRHAEILLSRLRHEHIDVVYCSTLRRAVQTAEPLAKQLRLPVRQRPELREIAFGVLEGKALDDPDPAVRAMLRRRLEDKAGFVPPGGESYRQVEERIAPLLERLHQEHAGQTVLIVGHRAVNRVILGLILGLPPAEYIRFDPRHQTLYEIRFRERPELLVHTLEDT